MQTGKAARLALVGLAVGLVAIGCQFVAGIAGLEGTEQACNEEDCGNYACNAEATACNTSCTRMTGGCREGAVCAAPMGQPGFCHECGWSAMPGVCPSGTCEACAGNVCTRVCDEPDECRSVAADAGPLTIPLDTRAAPARLECKDQCHDVLVSCVGGAPCEVVCEEGGCQNMTLRCSPDGACILVCKGQSCAGVTMLCGDNRCTATCDAAVEIDQVCGGSCDCKAEGCL